MSDLGLLYKQWRRYSQAESLLLETATRIQRVLGVEDPETLLAQSLLGAVYLDLHRPEEAEAVLTETLARMERIDHPEMVLVLYNLACAHALQNHRRVALGFLGRAIEAGIGFGIRADPALESLHGDPEFEALEHRNRLGTRWYPYLMYEIARTHIAQGNYEKAETILLEQVQVDPRDEEHEFAISLRLEWLGRTYLLQQRYVEAESVLMRSQEIRQRLLGEAHVDTATSEFLLGQVRLALGDTESALEFVQRAERTFGEFHLWHESSYQYLYCEAVRHAILGDREATMRDLRRAVTYGLPPQDWRARGRTFDELADDPEFQALGAEVARHFPFE